MIKQTATATKTAEQTIREFVLSYFAGIEHPVVKDECRYVEGEHWGWMVWCRTPADGIQRARLVGHFDGEGNPAVDEIK